MLYCNIFMNLFEIRYVPDYQSMIYNQLALLVLQFQIQI